MIHVVLSRGIKRKNTKTNSEIKVAAGKKFDITATQKVFEVVRKHAVKDFLEMGIGEDSVGKHFWMVRNTGDNCVKIYPEEGSTFVELPRLTLMGDLVESENF